MGALTLVLMFSAANAAPDAPAPAPSTATSATTPPATTTAPPVADAKPTVTAPEEPPSEVGLPTAFTKRELTLSQWQWEGSAHLGLVGTEGPTRFIDELRFAPLSWLELRTAFLPYPSSLMLRVRIGDASGLYGSVVVDGGLAHGDIGLKLGNSSDETRAGLRAHLEGGVTWAVDTGATTRFVAELRARDRISALTDDDEAIVAGSAALDVDLLRSLAVSVGFGYATTLNTPVREVSVSFIETGRPGMSWLLARDSGDTQSLTTPLGLVYAPTESFDVDVFVTPQIFPTLAMVAGAGVRIRL